MGKDLMFFITGLPRSRTAWFSAFMTASGFPCMHEAINGCKTLSEYKEKVKGVSDSNTAFGFFDIELDRPTLIINRYDRHNKKEFNKAKERLSKINGFHVDFCDIDKRITEIFTYLTGCEINLDVYAVFKDLNITTMKEIDIDSTKALLNEASK